MKRFNFEEIISQDEYRERIVKYLRYPMDVKVSKERFLHDLKFLDKIGEIDLTKDIEMIEHDFNKCVEEQGTETPNFAMENVIDEILNDIQSREGWADFIESEIPTLEDNYDVAKSVHGFYTKENNNKYFFSIDLRSANWQTIKSITGITGDYGDYIKSFTDMLIPPVSKTFRVKINGKLAVKQVQSYNKYLLLSNINLLMDTVNNLTAGAVKLTVDKLAAIYADEIIFEITHQELLDWELLEAVNKLHNNSYERQAYEETGLDLHLTTFKLVHTGLDNTYAKVFVNNTFSLKVLSKDMEMLFKRVEHNMYDDTTFTKKLLKTHNRDELILRISELISSYRNFHEIKSVEGA